MASKKGENKQHVMKENDLLYFGKYKGETVARVRLKDEEYLRWLKTEKKIKFAKKF